MSTLRDLTVKCMFEAIQSLAARGSMWVDPRQMEKVQTRPQQFDMAVDLANVLLDRLQGTEGPKPNRFDKTRRALAKKVGKGPRGIPRAQLLTPGG